MIFLRAEHAFPVFVDKETWCCECSWHQISIPHLLIIWSFSPFSNHSPSIFQAILMVFPCLSDDFPSCCSSNFSASIFSSDRWVQVSVPRSTCFATHPPPSMVLNHRDTKLFRTRFYPHHLLQLAWHGEKIGKKTYIEPISAPFFFLKPHQRSSTPWSFGGFDHQIPPDPTSLIFIAAEFASFTWRNQLTIFGSEHLPAIFDLNFWRTAGCVLLPSQGFHQKSNSYSN